MGFLYAWATPDYLLNQMSLSTISLYYVRGVDREMKRGERYGRESAIRFALYLSGQDYDKILEDERKKEEKLKAVRKKNKGPDLESFEKLYGNKIKRPDPP